MNLTAVNLQPILFPPRESVPEPQPGAANEQATGVNPPRSTPAPDQYPDVYVPTSAVPGAVEAGTQRPTGMPEHSGPRQNESPDEEQESKPLNDNQRPGSQRVASKAPGSLELTEEEKQEVEELRARDAAVRQHEQAHVMAGGRYVIRRAQFEYVLGPDGRLYAVGGEVQIDTSEVPDDPEATIQKAQAVRRAALAPSDPSAQDQRVAMQANQMEFEARMELARQRAEEFQQQTDEYNQNGQAITPQLEPILINLFA
ncbi:MAG: putative metalloprotease CJM1_0395 family protein [Candidatus Neomarinimicrobiota bacterium]